MKHLLLVFLGGGIGSGLRYLLSKSLNPYLSHFFLGTFGANILGCLIIGLAMGAATKSNLIESNTLLFITVGFCGGFTTFSSFALENYNLIKEGQLLAFLFYTLSSIITGVLAVVLGLWISRSL